MSDAIHQVSDTTGTFQFITLKITLAVIQVALFIVLALIAFCLIKAIIQAYFLIYAGFFLAGFIGSSWTISYWQRYFHAISAIAIKFFTICFIMGILIVQMQGWANDINNAKDIADLGTVILRVFGLAFLYALIIYQIPEWAATTLAGEINLQFASGFNSTASIMSGQSLNRSNSAPNSPSHNESPRSSSASNAPAKGNLHSLSGLSNTLKNGTFHSGIPGLSSTTNSGTKSTHGNRLTPTSAFKPRDTNVNTRSNSAKGQNNEAPTNSRPSTSNASDSTHNRN
jgi:type IV secretory pathway TrbL component